MTTTTNPRTTTRFNNFFLAVPLALALGACGYSGTPAERAQKRADSVLKEIEANDLQKAVVKTTVADLAKRFETSKAGRALNRDALGVQLAADKADLDVVTAQTVAVTSSFVADAHAFVDAAAKIHGTLTPAQRAKLTEKMKPGRPMKAAWFVAGRMGWGPPADAAEANERATKGIERALDRIDATEDQRKALRPLALGLVDEAAPLLDEREKITAALLDAWKSEKPDTASLHALIDTESVRIDALARSAADRAVRAHAILTPDQKKEIAARFADDGSCGRGGDADG